ncbi:hypothetical protein LCGC14_1197110 [marine sediment metagenome]|uniref:Uncharacterized protein n=1 Tax=marine sediment metagenome TaxID=412755 RepID=A0A0F9LI31_9ZZZZ|nr:hypothetical protein [archaeon]HEC37641.1 hypothetical protein [bacterium]
MLDKDWLSKTVFKLIENKSMEFKLIYIEHIIRPVINMFNDYKGNFYVSIILGYGYNYTSSGKSLFDELIQLNTELYKILFFYCVVNMEFIKYIVLEIVLIAHL